MEETELIQWAGGRQQRNWHLESDVDDDQTVEVETLLGRSSRLPLSQLWLCVIHTDHRQQLQLWLLLLFLLSDSLMALEASTTKDALIMFLQRKHSNTLHKRHCTYFNESCSSSVKSAVLDNILHVFPKLQSHRTQQVFLPINYLFS